MMLHQSGMHAQASCHSEAAAFVSSPSTMPLLENFTGIDIFERVAQAMYCCMLLFVPSFWLEDNFTKYKTAKPDAQDIALCRILGVLCICIFIAVSQLRINGVNLKSADLMSVVLSLIHISEPTRRTPISYAVFCLKKKKWNTPS